VQTSTASEAVEALIQDYGRLVFHVIHGLTGNWQESEDLSQETFLQAFRGIEAARAASGPHFQAKAWLLQIALNTVRMQRRRLPVARFLTFSDLQASSSEGQEESLEPASPGDLALQVAERDVVQRSLAALPETLRLPLLLASVAGFSQKEIAGLLGLNEATTRQRLSRARKAFERLYALESGEHLAPAPARVGSVRPLIRRRPGLFAPVALPVQA